MTDRPINDLPPHDRRRFFATGLRRIIRPLAELVEQKLPIALPAFRTRLRPPGALPEQRFLDTCHRCGLCAEACPADAILLTQTLSAPDRGTPCVDPDKQACVICDELACMQVCPSGALQLVDRLEIRMGLARADHDVCLRSHGENCTICIDRCPIASTAIRLDERGRVQVIDPAVSGTGCTGCGVCQQYCPTTPEKAIRVYPY